MPIHFVYWKPGNPFDRLSLFPIVCNVLEKFERGKPNKTTWLALMCVLC